MNIRTGRNENGKWKKLHKELHNLCHFPSIIRVMNYRRLRWTGHVAILEDGRSAF